MDKAPVPDNTAGAVPADVTAGRTYWGLRTDGTWGPQVGTSMAFPPAPTANATVDAWSENAGWIKLGNDDGGPYLNSTTQSWGVVHDGSGGLFGYA